MQNILVTGGAGFIGSNLVLELQSRHPMAKIVVLDDFRSGHFKNLEGFRGDTVAADVSRLDWNVRFHDTIFDAIFHLASITDTTIHDQYLQIHDNVEGFRRLLQFAQKNMTPVIYASSAAVYGTGGGKMSEHQCPSPANVYAFTKVQLDNLARLYASQHPVWKLVGIRYFNVFGPRESYKDKAASMIYQLYLQLKQGTNPRVFKSGEQKRDFVYVKDAVELTIHALSSAKSTVINCGSGAPLSFNQIIETLNACLGLNLAPDYFDNPYPFYQPHTEADLEKVKAELDWSPKWTANKGIADYVEWLENRNSI